MGLTGSSELLNDSKWGDNNHCHHQSQSCFKIFFFDGDDMLPDLVLQHSLLPSLQKLIDGVDAGVDELEVWNSGPDGS